MSRKQTSSILRIPPVLYTRAKAEDVEDSEQPEVVVLSSSSSDEVEPELEALCSDDKVVDSKPGDEPVEISSSDDEIVTSSRASNDMGSVWTCRRKADASSEVVASSQPAVASSPTAAIVESSRASSTLSIESPLEYCMPTSSLEDHLEYCMQSTFETLDEWPPTADGLPDAPDVKDLEDDVFLPNESVRPRVLKRQRAYYIPTRNRELVEKRAHKM